MILPNSPNTPSFRIGESDAWQIKDDAGKIVSKGLKTNRIILSKADDFHRLDMHVHNFAISESSPLFNFGRWVEMKYTDPKSGQEKSIWLNRNSVIKRLTLGADRRAVRLSQDDVEKALNKTNELAKFLEIVPGYLAAKQVQGDQPSNASPSKTQSAKRSGPPSSRGAPGGAQRAITSAPHPSTTPSNPVTLHKGDAKKPPAGGVRIIPPSETQHAEGEFYAKVKDKLITKLKEHQPKFTPKEIASYAANFDNAIKDIDSFFETHQNLQTEKDSEGRIQTGFGGFRLLNSSGLFGDKEIDDAVITFLTCFGISEVSKPK